MRLGPDAIQVGAWNVGKSNRKKKKDCEAEGHRSWIKFRFMGSCLSARSKADGSVSGTSSQSVVQTYNANAFDYNLCIGQHVICCIIDKWHVDLL
ncbi:hypothetical protein SLEP1_g20298 [Rubroshorea leprosula]|uniref:Uncharacterized protein n=1 Tax=Rubroshorea leprosula TaxID=152421 RepID=A0AAV5J898_9ROSI|nr:hypothetical protein SLEP1_g20298 [Rubroshorea leprosula]